MVGALLKIMIVDDHAERVAALRPALKEAGYRVVGTVAPDDYLPDRVRTLEPDVILVALDAPGRDTLERLSALSRELPRPIAMLIETCDPQVIPKAVMAGVSAYVVGNLCEEQVRLAVEVALAQFQHFRHMQDELAQARAALEERKLIERAKGILMERGKLSEADAYRRLRSLSMNRSRKLVEVAQDVIEMAGLFQDSSNGEQ